MAEGTDDYQKGLIENFIAVTGADVERASFFLQSAAWNLQASGPVACAVQLGAS